MLSLYEASDTGCSMSDSKRSIELEIQQIQVDDSLVSMTPTRIIEFQLLLPMSFVGKSFRGRSKRLILNNEYTLFSQFRFRSPR